MLQKKISKLNSMNKENIVLGLLAMIAAFIGAIGISFGVFLAQNNQLIPPATAHHEEIFSCSKFFAYDDDNHCSTGHQQEICGTNVLPENAQLPYAPILSIEALKKDFLMLSSKFPHLKLRKEDAIFIHNLIIKYEKRSKFNYLIHDVRMMQKALLTIIEGLNELFSIAEACINPSPEKNEEGKRTFGTLYDRRQTYARTIQGQTGDINWNVYTAEEKRRITKIIVRIGFSLDILMKNCWAKYYEDDKTDGFIPYFDLCSKGKLFGTILFEHLTKKRPKTESKKSQLEGDRRLIRSTEKRRSIEVDILRQYSETDEHSADENVEAKDDFDRQGNTNTINDFGLDRLNQ